MTRLRAYFPIRRLRTQLHISLGKNKKVDVFQVEFRCVEYIYILFRNLLYIEFILYLDK